MAGSRSDGAGGDGKLGPADLPAAVTEAVEAQRTYERARPTRLGQGAERMTRPFGSALAKLIPPEVARMALQQADNAAGLTLPGELTGHDVNDIAACEARALRVQAWAQGTNAATGGAAGWFGAAGLAVDVPATVTLAARTVRATGAAYGIAGDDEAERAFRLMVLEVATTMAQDERQQRLDQLNVMARSMASPEARAAGQWLTEKVFERIARQLGISLAARKAAQVVPVVGGLVGAAVNASFQADVARAARYAYRQRWLIARKVLPAPGGDHDPG